MRPMCLLLLNDGVTSQGSWSCKIISTPLDKERSLEFKYFASQESNLPSLFCAPSFFLSNRLLFSQVLHDLFFLFSLLMNIFSQFFLIFTHFPWAQRFERKLLALMLE